MTVVDPEQVVEHEHLTVGAAAGADPDHRDLEALHHDVGDGGWDRLEHDREAAGLLQRDRVTRNLERAFGVATLGAVAAERRGRLRGQADMAHDRDPGVDDRSRPLRRWYRRARA